MRELRILVAFSLHTKFELPKFIRFEEMTVGGPQRKLLLRQQYLPEP